MHLRFARPDAEAAYPPINGDGDFDAWSGINSGALALPDAVIAANIDTNWGAASSVAARVVDNGSLVVTLNPQSLGGNLSRKACKDAKGPWVPGCTKMAMMMRQLKARRGPHVWYTRNVSLHHRHLSM